MRTRTFSLALALAAVTGVAAAVQRPAADGLLMKSALFTWESVPERPPSRAHAGPCSPRPRPPSTNSSTTRRR